MPQSLVLMILAFVFVGVMSVVQGLYWAYVARQEKEAEELLRRLTGGGSDAIEESLLREHEEDATAQALGGFGSKLQQTLISADSRLSVGDMALRMALAGVAGAIAGIFALGVPGMVLGIATGYAPYFFLR